MSESLESIDVEAIVDRARALWRQAIDRATTAGVELFAKVATRFRITRDLEGLGATSDRAFETGLALRLFRAGRDRAGFAAASGLSTDVVRWIVDNADTYRTQAVACAPRMSDSIDAARWDLDDSTALPTQEKLTTALLVRPQVEWIEAGTTVEVLIGAEGWVAARRRHRLWALRARPDRTLVAQRGIAGWERLLDAADKVETPTSSTPAKEPNLVVMTPEAAAPLVAILADAFHGAGSPGRVRCGRGWDVVDEPTRPDGLAGGAFDDAGFPAKSRILAANGLWVDRLSGSGTFRRASYREPPTESATNLVMAPGDKAIMPAEARIVRRCRVLRLSPELWVLELDSAGAGTGDDPQRNWVRVRPKTLIGACSSRFGPARATPEGPVVPTLLFEGLAET